MAATKELVVEAAYIVLRSHGKHNELACTFLTFVKSSLKAAERLASHLNDLLPILANICAGPEKTMFLSISIPPNGAGQN